MPWALALTLLLAGGNGVEWLGPRPERPQRIVSLAPSATEVLFALGAGDRVVGVTRYDRNPPAVRELPTVGGFIDPDPEAVLALRPDLAVAVRTSGGRARVDTLVRLGVPVLVLPAETIADMWIAIRALGDALGLASRAHELEQRLRRGIDAVSRRQHAGAPLRALVIVGRRPLVAAGAGTFLDALLRTLNATNVVTRGGAYPRMDLEAVITLDPDVIIDVTLGEDESSSAFWARAPSVRAVRDGRVIHIESDALLRPGPRLPEGLRLLGAALRPEKP